MSVARLPVLRPSTDLADAAGRDERVILWCWTCSRSFEADARTALGVFGAISFGRLIGKRECRRCREKLWVIFPWYAPTPRDWVNQDRPMSDVPASYIEPPRSEFIFQIESIDPAGDVFETRTLTRDLDLAHIAFDMKLKTLRPGRDRYWLREHTRLMRDSVRDLKVVE
ncbi:MAG TPA: hypothetical protein VHZ78_08475 [Rhizomicrobium sp.]|jgi:hypothetical protein|nr:hypothetical protein [Rhizomicrobium sp.]